MSSFWSMSLSCHDCLSDLLCAEDAGILAGDEPEYSPDLEFPEDIEESIIAGFVEGEGVYAPGFDYPARFRSRSLDASAREEAVGWILKRSNGWPLQLLCVASLSLAAKMEETLVPSFLDLQIQGARFIFEPRTIRRMELLVLSALDWRLRSITPFSFIDFFAYKLDSTRASRRFLVSRATQFILATIQEIDFLDYGPSVVAAVAVLCAANATTDLPLINPGDAASWCIGLSKERILSCYGLMQAVVVDTRPRKPPKILPQLRVTTPAVLGAGNSSSLSSSPSKKRRKLSHKKWVEDDDDVER
ncbi:cyclin-D1-1 isoform X2 [Magnolia sinica]|uniref:cyclin-D1-1 isoform X2 n=1 Tax=Magnolia sinica TaxID=86752 RepID=UPI00265AC066|nr:cyclin-D1-1 isoform X2 [Magnolia sinica]